ncbi:MAG TPA: multiubiquitin domain-containing protein [Polaromonas sp.]|uniref:multiubiquitin domain-containing protein n=1 Tax=Polaromonas sp. TaxID=1869339 RepID=UPI002D4D3539|nr:multiubiquitin domain-containing protein [Polaromonas sp.]HYW58504.1 multiubiquitin domain-containing protein [Polaromonas sp.]
MSHAIKVHSDDGSHGASSASKKEVRIFVNTREFMVPKTRLTYQELVEMAYPGDVPGPDKVYEITYSSEHGPDGSVGVGGEVKLKEGMVFNVGITNRS